MGYDLYAIKPEHYKKYGQKTLDIQNIFDDNWYTTTEYSYNHCIWKNWRNGFFDDERTIYISSDLEFFYSSIYDSKTANEFIDNVKLFFENESLDPDINLKEFVSWLKFWASKDAKFLLSR